MGRKPKSEPEQMDLIDVDTADGKAAMKIGRAYRRLREANAEQRQSFREKEAAAADKFREAIAALGIKPHADGSYRFALDGYLVTIPAVKNPPIKMKPLKDAEESDDDDNDSEGD